MYETSNVGKYQPVVIGIDHGFSLIKTYHHIMSNGVAKTSGRPPVLENSLYYDGNYYVMGGSRMTVNEDKTENDNYFILTLAAIASLYREKQGKGIADERKAELQECARMAANEVREIVLDIINTAIADLKTSAIRVSPTDSDISSKSIENMGMKPPESSEVLLDDICDFMNMLV